MQNFLSGDWRHPCQTRYAPNRLNALATALLIAALILIQCLIGGTRLLFSLPAFALIGAALLTALAAGKRLPGRGGKAAIATVLLTFAYVLARAAMSPFQHLWWPDFLSALACLGVYLLTAYYLNRQERSAVIFVLLALAVGELFVGLRQFTEGQNWMPFGFMRAESGRRASGMFISSIHLAGYLEAVGVFALSMAMWSGWKTWARWLAGYIGALCFFGVAITGSRGGYISSLAALLSLTALSLYIVRWARPKIFPARATWVTLLVVGGLVGSWAAMSLDPTLRARLELLSAQFERNRLDVRIYNWQAALDQFRVNPLTGTGAGTHLYLGRTFRRPQIQSDPVHAHSDYLELLAEYGIIGAVGFGLVLGTHALSGLRALSRAAHGPLRDLHPQESASHDGAAMTIGALSAFAAYLAHSAIDFNLHIPGNALLFAFIFGVLANPLGDEQKPSNDAAPERWLLLPIGLALIVFAALKLPGEFWSEKARVALRSHQFSAAITLANRALEHAPRNPDVHFYIGEANRNLARTVPLRAMQHSLLENAATAYRASIAIFPADENAWVRLGQALDGLREFSAAETAYLTAIQLDPNLGVLYAFYAAHLQARGRTEESRVQMENARKLGFTEFSQMLPAGAFPPDDIPNVSAK